MTDTHKTARYTIRIAPVTLTRLHEIAKLLHTSLPDLLVTGALCLAIRATSPATFLVEKSLSIPDLPITLPEPPAEP